MVTQTKRWCYYISPTRVNKNGEYQVGIVTEDESGYQLTDWFWGKDFDLANKIADERNLKLGLTQEDCFHIIASSMRISKSQ